MIKFKLERILESIENYNLSNFYSILEATCTMLNTMYDEYHSESLVEMFECNNESIMYFDENLEEFLRLFEIEYAMEDGLLVMEQDAKKFSFEYTEKENRHDVDLPNEILINLNTFKKYL